LFDFPAEAGNNLWCCFDTNPASRDKQAGMLVLPDGICPNMQSHELQAGTAKGWTKSGEYLRFPYKRIGGFKQGLFVAGVAILLGVLLYTNWIVNGLRRNSRAHVTLKVERFKSLFIQGDEALDIYLNEMAKKDFPLIVADVDHEPTSWSGLPELDELPKEEANERAKALMRQWNRQGNFPVPLELDEYNLTQFFYYGDSDQIRRLQYLPWIEFVMVGGLILIGYIGFVNLKKSEERSVWVGMARETAHQMGTPLTSLYGWLELLDEEPENRPDISTIRDEMESDINRLKTVAERFNRIGSKAGFLTVSVESIVENAVNYIRHRLPQLASGEVELESTFPSGMTIRVNPDLFGWVIENLLRNAVEALHGKGGKVTVRGSLKGNKIAFDVIDNGSGIGRSDWRNIFRPGYSTKKRGWGLGLSLARRIVEDIHRGKIMVVESKAGVGTVIRVLLPLD
jgi:two-component system, NtrC family, sensor histidine kinase KinB